MPCFVAGHTEPVLVIRGGQPIEAQHGIQRQINSIEFDMGHGMDQGGPPSLRTEFALAHLGRVNQFGTIWPTGLPRHGLLQRRRLMVVQRQHLFALTGRVRL